MDANIEQGTTAGRRPKAREQRQNRLWQSGWRTVAASSPKPDRSPIIRAASRAGLDMRTSNEPASSSGLAIDRKHNLYKLSSLRLLAVDISYRPAGHAPALRKDKAPAAGDFDINTADRGMRLVSAALSYVVGADRRKFGLRGKAGRE